MVLSGGARESSLVRHIIEPGGEGGRGVCYSYRAAPGSGGHGRGGEGAGGRSESLCRGRKSSGAERESGRNLSEQKLRSLILEKLWRPEMEAAQSAEVGTRWEQPLACMASGLQQGLPCTPRQGVLERRADEWCPCQ